MSLANEHPELLQSTQVDIPQKALSTIVLPDKSIPKALIPQLALGLSERMREFTDSMTVFVMLKQTEQIVKSALEQTLDHALVKMQGKEMSCFGATVTTRSIKEYEYDDPGLRELERQAKELKEKIDGRKEFMRLIKTAQADAATGEIVEPAKLARHGTTLAVKFN